MFSIPCRKDSAQLTSTLGTQWHATTAETDIGWTQNLFASVFVNQPIETATLKDFGTAVVKAWNDFVDPNPRTRTFAK